MTDAELKPCNKCSGNAGICSHAFPGGNGITYSVFSRSPINETRKFCVLCENTECNPLWIEIEWFDDFNKAIEAWNRRVNEA